MAEKIKIGKHKRIKKQVHDLLSEYYDLNDVDNICTITLKFENFQDCFELNEAKSPVLNPSLLEKIENISLKIPNVYDIVFDVKIDDYGEYDKNKASDYFLKSCYMMAMKQDRINLNKRKLAFFFGAAGVFSLMIMFLLENLFFEQGSVSGEITCEILDIIAWVFLWEAVTFYFLDRAENNFKWKKINKRIKEVSFK